MDLACELIAAASVDECATATGVRLDCEHRDVDVVLQTETPEGIAVVLPSLVYAKILEEHAAVADLDLIDRTIRAPNVRKPDPRPDRERFFRREQGLSVLAVVEFGAVPAIIVTVFSADYPQL